MAFPTGIEVQTAISSSDEKLDHSYASIFAKQISSSDDGGWRLLQQVFNFHFIASNITTPFLPMAIMGEQRSMIPDDITGDELDYLATLFMEVTDPEFIARIADIIWLRRRDPDAARAAVIAYLETGKRLEDPEHWVASMERYERGLRLGWQIEPNGELPKTILNHLEARAIHYNGTDPLFLSQKIFSLLHEFKYGDFGKLASIAGTSAGESRKEKNFDRARAYYDAQAKLLSINKATDKSELALVAIAETFIEEAELREAEHSFIAAHFSWQEAINACKNRPSLRSKIPELQKRLSHAGEKSLQEMKSFSQDIEIREYVEKAKKSASGLSPDDAFFYLFCCHPPINYNEIRTSTEQQIRDNPLQASVGTDILDSTGRKVGVRPPALTDDKEQYETALNGFIEQNCNLHRDITSHAFLIPTYNTVLEEHHFTGERIHQLVGDSEFIPEGRLNLFIKAIDFGFKREIDTALHILIPQVENSLREILRQNGIEPRNIDNNGVEDVWGLERILSTSTTQDILGEDFVFELRSLLVERLGQNIRNLIAHGLVSSNHFDKTTFFYLWWFLVKLAVYPTSGMKEYIQRVKAKNSEKTP